MKRLLLLLPVLFVLLLFIAWPQLEILRQSLLADDSWSLRHYARFFDLDAPANLEALWNSIWLSLVSVLCAALVGIPLALLVSRVVFPLRGTLAALAVLPLLLPPIVGVLTFKQFLFGEYGLVPRALHELLGIRWFLDGFTGIIVLHAYAFFPFFYLFVAAGQKRLDPALPEAAWSLGASRIRTLLRITLPLLMPAIAGAAILVLLNAMGSFSAPLFFAPTEEILTLRIANLRESDTAIVTVISTILAVTALFLLVPMRRLESRTDVISAAKGQITPMRPPGRRLGQFLLGLLAATLVIVLLLPHLSIVLLSFAANEGASTSVLPQEYSLDHYRTILTDDTFLGPITNSFQMALLAAALNVVVGLAIGFLLSQRKTPLRRSIELLAFLPLALPATVIAFNLLKTFATPTPFTLNRALAGTWILLPLAYFVRHLPIAVRATQSALKTLDPSLVDAAQSLGASRFTTFRRVTLPLLLPGVLSGALLCFLAGLSEFVASILIYIPENKPISIEIFDSFYDGSLGEPAALSVLLLFSQALIAVAVNRFLRVEKSTAEG